uniref:RING-type domain-containing protein n=1 Tax=Arcella intermedia TaxID=1963864 RepID=A0A6B2LP60_9EUKA
MTSYAQYLEKQNADLLTLREVVQIEKEELERKVSIRNSIIKRLKAVEKKFFSPKAIQSLTSDDPQQEDWKKRSLEKLTLEQLENLLNTAKKEKKKKLESEEEKKLCVVCLTAKRQVVCIPCYHICLCEGCSKKVKNMCPLDRQSVTFSKVYV